MRYALGYEERTSDLLVKAGDDQVNINLSPFINGGGEADCLKRFRSYLGSLAQKIRQGDCIVTSFEPLNCDIRAALQRRHSIGQSDYDKINTLITAFIIQFRSAEFDKKGVTPFPGSYAKIWEQGALYVRYGIVELRVLENWLRDKSGLLSAYANVLRNLDDEEYMYRDAIRPHWLSTADAEFNLRKLMTNAGFYEALDGANDSLVFWVQDYLEALAESTYVFPAPPAYPSFFSTQAYLFEKLGALKQYIGFPNPATFYQMLAGHDVLFMTPFHSEISELFQSRKFFSLYKDIAIPEFNLTTLRASISTYPNRPRGSWLETYRCLTAEIDAAFAKQKFTLFFASCGCYGLPICRYVFNKYGCTAVYYGNLLNTLFGVRQSCSEGFLSGRRLLENWAVGRLGEFRNVDRIDGGRYV